MAVDRDREQFARRQIAALTQRGVARESARQRVEELLGPLDGDLFDAAGFPLLQDLVQGFDPGSRPPDGLVQRVIDRHGARSGTFRQVLRAVATVQVYAVAVAAVATVIWGVWLRFVGPQFAELYATMGATLPVLTRWFIDPLTGALVFAVIWGVVLLLAWTHRDLMAVLGRLRPPGRLLRRLPATARLTRVFVDWLSVVCVAAAVDEGVGADRSLGLVGEWRHRMGYRRWGRGEGESDSGLGEALQMASRLGTLDDEAAYQSERLEMEFSIQAARTREALMVILLVTFGVCIGALVISLYLPIFELAALI